MNESASSPPSQSRARLSTQSLAVPDTQTRPQRGWRLSEQARPAAADDCVYTAHYRRNNRRHADVVCTVASISR